MKIKMLNLLFYFMYKEWSTRNCENKKEEKKKKKKEENFQNKKKKKKKKTKDIVKDQMFF